MIMIGAPPVTTTKEIGFSDPASVDAVRFRLSESGCFTVALRRPSCPPVVVNGFATRESAMKVAAAMPVPWDPNFQLPSIETWSVDASS